MNKTNKIYTLFLGLLFFGSVAFASTGIIYHGDSLFPIDQNLLVLDSNDTTGDIIMQWGNALNERLYWDADGGDGTGIFDFTDSLYVQGFLSLFPMSLPGAPSTGDIVVDSGDSNTLKWYNGSVWQSAGGSGVKKMLIEPSTGVHQADGTANNCDSWREYDYTDLEQYNKILGNAADQDLDVVYKAWLPSDFSSWDTTAIAVVYKTSSATTTTSGVSCQVFDTNNASAHTTSNAASTSEAAFIFTVTNLTDGSEVWTPGNHFLIKCKGVVDSAAWVDIGRIEYTYNY